MTAHVLGDVATVVDCEHRTAPRANADFFGFSIGTRDVRAGRVRLENAKPVTRSTFDSWTRRAVPSPGDLIFSREAPMGEVGAVPNGASVCLGQRTVLLRNNASLVDYRYLLLILMAPESQNWIRRNSVGSTVLHLNVSDVRRIPLPCLPTLRAQRRIVDIVDDYMAHLETADSSVIAAVRRIESWSDGYIDETIRSAASQIVRVSEILREPMRNGRSDRAVSGADEGVRTLTLTAVTKNEFVDDFTKRTGTPLMRTAGLWLEPGDIFVQRSNTPELVGSAARFDGPMNWAIFPDLLVRLRVDESIVDSRFAAAALRSRSIHQNLRSKAKGLAGSMPKIDQSAIGSTLLPLPSLEDQRSIVSRIDVAAGAASRTILKCAVTQNRSDRLRRSLLSSVFSGRISRVADLDVIEEARDL